MPRMFALAALAALLLSAAPAALASSTTMNLYVTNQAHGEKLTAEVKGSNGYYEVQNLTSMQTTFSDQDTAYFLDQKTYTYNLKVYRSGTTQLVCEGVVQVENVWGVGPKVVSCRANIWQGACAVMGKGKLTGICEVYIGVQ